MPENIPITARPSSSTVSSPAMPPTAGSIVHARVEQVLSENRYQLKIEGALYEATLPLSLEQGKTIAVHIRNTSSETLEMDVLPQPTPEASPRIEPLSIQAILEGLNLPNDEELHRIVRLFIGMGAPLEEDSVLAALSAARSFGGTPSANYAAALLAASGIDPVPQHVERLIRFMDVPPPTTELSPAHDLSRIISKIVESTLVLGENADALERDIARALNTLQSPQPTGIAIERWIHAVLEGSPRLMALDRLIFLVDAAIEETADASGSIQRLGQAIETVRTWIEEQKVFSAEELRRILPPGREDLQQLRSVLLEWEQREIQSRPALQDARANHGTAFETLDRWSAARTVNHLTALRGEGPLVFEIPIRIEGRHQAFQLRIYDRPGEDQRRGTRSSRRTFSVEIQMSRIGPVRSCVDLIGKRVGVRFSVRDSSIRTLFEKSLSELTQNLSARGYESDLHVDIRRPGDPASLPETPLLSVDLRA